MYCITEPGWSCTLLQHWELQNLYLFTTSVMPFTNAQIISPVRYHFNTFIRIYWNFTNAVRWACRLLDLCTTVILLYILGLSLENPQLSHERWTHMMDGVIRSYPGFCAFRTRQKLNEIGGKKWMELFQIYFNARCHCTASENYFNI